MISGVLPNVATARSISTKAFRKYFWWADITNKTERKIPMFILGSQRSGTTMIFKVLGTCQECGVLWGHDKRVFLASRVKSMAAVRRLIKKTYKKVVVFKPLNDIQHTHELLALHPNARGIWVYRNFNDVVNSAVARWGTAHRDIIRGIAVGTVLHPGHDAIREGMDDEDIDTAKHACQGEISPEEGAALLWYFRNLLFFKLRLHQDPRILIVKYEDLATDPRHQFRRIFDHASCEFRPESIKDVFSSSIEKASAPALRDSIKTLCDGMLRRLNAHYSMAAS